MRVPGLYSVLIPLYFYMLQSIENWYDKRKWRLFKFMFYTTISLTRTYRINQTKDHTLLFCSIFSVSCLIFKFMLLSVPAGVRPIIWKIIFTFTHSKDRHRISVKKILWKIIWIFKFCLPPLNIEVYIQSTISFTP